MILFNLQVFEKSKKLLRNNASRLNNVFSNCDSASFSLKVLQRKRHSFNKQCISFRLLEKKTVNVFDQINLQKKHVFDKKQYKKFFT